MSPAKPKPARCLVEYWKCSEEGFCNTGKVAEETFTGDNCGCWSFNQCRQRKIRINYTAGACPCDCDEDHRMKHPPPILADGRIWLYTGEIVPGPEVPDPRRVEYIKRAYPDQAKLAPSASVPIHQATAQGTPRPTLPKSAVAKDHKEARSLGDPYPTTAGMRSMVGRKKPIENEETSDLSANPNAAKPAYPMAQTCNRATTPTKYSADTVASATAVTYNTPAQYPADIVALLSPQHINSVPRQHILLNCPLLKNEEETLGSEKVGAQAIRSRRWHVPRTRLELRD
jgi:hypothetical protein